jgi:hypothetical protein
MSTGELLSVLKMTERVTAHEYVDEGGGGREGGVKFKIEMSSCG